MFRTFLEFIDSFFIIDLGSSRILLHLELINNGCLPNCFRVYDQFFRFYVETNSAKKNFVTKTTLFDIYQQFILNISLYARLPVSEIGNLKLFGRELKKG